MDQSDDKPQFTMTRLRIVTVEPEMNENQMALHQTLGGLCAFLTSADLANFHFTEMFRELSGEGNPWAIYEVGVYLDHTKTVEIIPVHDGITIADPQMSGTIPEHIQIVREEERMAELIQIWHDGVMNG